MFTTIIIIVIILFGIVGTSSSKALKPGETRIEVDVPNPEKCQDKTMLDFIAETPNYKLEPIFKKYIGLGLLLKPLFLDAYHDKIRTGFLIRSVYYERAGITEVPPQTADEIIYTIHKRIEKERESYTNELELEIAGVHVPTRKSFIKNYCEELDMVELVPEPRNKFDKNAIKVRCNERLIGYIPSSDTQEVNAYLSYKNYDKGYLTAEIIIEY
jgi:hypothetical protein